VLIGSRISNPMYVLMCPVTAQYSGEPADALAVWYSVMSMLCPATLVVAASSAQDFLAGSTFRLAMAVLESSVGTFATSDQLLAVEPAVC
jgi:hypothetical protein